MIAPMPPATARPVQNEGFMRPVRATDEPRRHQRLRGGAAPTLRQFGTTVPLRMLDVHQPDRKPASGADADADPARHFERLWRCKACGHCIAADAARDVVD